MRADEPRARLKKAVRLLHLWVGLVTGAVVFIIGVTGALYAFEKELRHWVHHDRYFVQVPAGAARVPLQVQVDAANAAIAGEAPLIQLRVFADPARTVEFRYERSAPGELGYAANTPVTKRVYTNPYTGEVVKVSNYKWEALEVVQWLHTSLLLGYEYGSVLTGWSVVLFFGMMASGLILWWPRNRGALRHKLWFRWGDRTGWKRKNYDLHSILGVYAITVASIIALTGLVWSFDWVERRVRWIANGGRHADSAWVRSTPRDDRVADPVDRIHARLSADHPDAYYQVIHLSTAEAEDGVYYGTAFHVDGMWKNSAYAFDKYTLERIKTRRHEEKTNGAILYDMNYDIHTGQILGLPGKVLACGVSLVVASLPVSGVLLWWGRRKKRG